MHPILFSIGRLTVYSYGAMLAVAFTAAAFLASRRAHIFNISKDTVGGLAFTLLVWGIIGARTLYVLLNIGYFRSHPFEALLINRGGLVFYGGVLTAAAAGVVFARARRLPVLDTADLITPFLALGHAIGRVGCFLNGCCYGKPTRSFIGVLFPYSDVKVYPTQLFSSAGLFIIFLVLFYMQARRKFKGEVISSYLILYGIFRFCMDFLRGDLEPVLCGLTITQIISAIFVFIGFMLGVVTRHHSRHSKTVPDETQ